MLKNLIAIAGTAGSTGVDVNSVMVTAFTDGANQMTASIGSIAPIGIGVVVAGAVVGFGIKFFKRITGKA